ncbi:MAG: AAA family ATPase [Chlamydiia bacterium]|nr:AAA family ATPase [Chlamydiia bacterium]
MKNLPIGIQSIKNILGNHGYVYIDKTGLIKKLIDEGAPHYFLTRPRRFGKSLLLSTLAAVFRGEKELFKGCHIYETDYDWQEHPVIHLDLSKMFNTTPEVLEVGLREALEDVASLYDLPLSGSTSVSCLNRLVTALSKKNKVVVLIDEYDKPIVDQLHNLEVAKQNREVLKGLYGALKGLDEHLRFTFTTGVSKFTQVSLFSGLNHLKDITMDPTYAGIVGYTEDEIKRTFPDHLEVVVSAYKSQGKSADKESILEELRFWYNGYRFTENDLCVYNPFSTLNFLEDKKIKAYWYRTGTPSFLIEELKKHPSSMVSLDSAIATEKEMMDISSLKDIDLKALMFQTGYFTIKAYNPLSNRYTLGLPNEEVRTSFLDSLVKHFANIVEVKSSESFVQALQNHQVETLFQHLSQGFASFAYQVFADAKECTYQGMLLSMLFGMGFDPLSERATNVGRIDVVLEIQKITYILELKLDDNANAALKQIRKKEYFKPYLHKGKEIALIGANFSSETRNISSWEGEILSEEGSIIKQLSSEK